jgi:heat shock protein HslJ/uncharacterized lipoprotein NlpE involved in copper resistance
MACQNPRAEAALHRINMSGIPTAHRALWQTVGLALLLTACSPPPHAAAPVDATYADADMTLTLFADRSFRLRVRDPVASGTPDSYDLGRWASDADGSVLLRGGRDAPMRLGSAVGDGLQLLDTRGKPIRELKRQAEVDRLNGPMRLRGMYFYMADAAILDECLTGRRWPVQIDGGHLALERAYLAHRAQGGGEWVLATLNARFVMREPEPGLLPREVLVVEGFDRLWPRETCAADAPATASLLNTRWRLVAIEGQPVHVAEGRREPWLQLYGEGNRVRGHGGCNDFSGRFEQGSDGFLFKGLTSARRDCPGEAGVQEARYLAALQATATRQVVGDTLQLRDAQGRVRLRFEALYLR